MSETTTAEGPAEGAHGSKRVCVIGLGTIGLPTARTIKRSGFAVVGYDTDASKVAAVKEFPAYTDWLSLPRCDVYVVCVPTGVSDGRIELSAIEKTAANLASTGLDEATLVCVESTVTPGVCRAIAEKIGKVMLVHAPHRYWVESPSNHGVKQMRVIGAADRASMQAGLRFYGQVGVPLTPMESLEEAEMTKVVENSFRFVQIAFAEEMATLCSGLGLDWDAIREAANTKWNIKIPEARDGIEGCLAKDVRYLLQLMGTSREGLVPAAIVADEKYTAKRRERLGPAQPLLSAKRRPPTSTD